MTDQITSIYDTNALAIQHNRLKYYDITNQLNNFNEIYGMNKYVDDLNGKKKEELERFKNQLIGQFYSLKQRYFLQEYTNNNIKFWTDMVIYTLIVMCIGIIVVAMFNEKYKNKSSLLMIILGVIGILYLIGFILAVGTKMSRRRYAWNQFYWQKAP